MNSCRLRLAKLLRCVLVKLVALAIGLTFLIPVFAHDLWVVPERYHLEAAGLLRVEARTGMEFPVSTNAIKPDRPAEFKLIWSGGEKKVSGLREEKTALVGELEVPASTDAIASLVLHPRFIELEAKDFNEYLEHEGLDSILALRKQRGESEAIGRERYQKFAKALLAGKNTDPNLFTTPLGHTLEIVPLEHFAHARKGASHAFQVLYQGKPLADAQVSAYEADVKEPLDTARTDAEGRVQFVLDGEGPWAIRLVYMIPVEDPEVDWKSFFATLTFAAPPARD